MLSHAAMHFALAGRCGSAHASASSAQRRLLSRLAVPTSRCRLHPHCATTCCRLYPHHANCRYDSEARLIKAWLPELAGLPVDLAHQPWAASPDQLAAARLRLGEPSAAGEAAGEAAQSVDLAGTGSAAAEAAAAVAQEAAAAQKPPAAAGDEGPLFYPLPVIDPATQIGKAPKPRR